MPTERDTLLAAASAEKWREWAKDPFRRWKGCLLCEVYVDCEPCRRAGGHDPDKEGCPPPDTGLTPSESAIARLKRAGIWEEDWYALG